MFVPIVLVGFAFAISISIVRAQLNLSRLNKTDRIACEFLNADANVRTKQAQNSLVASAAGSVFIVRTQTLKQLFGRHVKGQTAAQRASQELLVGYLDSQQTYGKATLKQQGKNIVLTRQLAAKARALSNQLNC